MWSAKAPLTAACTLTFTFIHFSRRSYSKQLTVKYRDIPPKASSVKCLAQGHNVICRGWESKSATFWLIAGFPNRSAFWPQILVCLQEDSRGRWTLQLLQSRLIIASPAMHVQKNHDKMVGRENRLTQMACQCRIAMEAVLFVQVE